MAMSKIKYAAAVLSAVLLSGCVMYSDKDEVENPQLDVTDLMYFNYVEPVFRITELADFFDRYQAVRDDREQSESLGAECFGEYFMPGNLYYEEFSVYPMWGKIFLTDSPGEYVCIPASSRQWNNIYTEYSVKALGDRRYSISCDTSDDPDKTWKSLSVDAVIDCSSGEGIFPSLSAGTGRSASILMAEYCISRFPELSPIPLMSIMAGQTLR